MARVSIADLVAQLHTGKLDRREFVKRAGAAGLSAGLIGNAIAAYDAKAQDASPAAGGSATDIGLSDVTHVTDTSKGTIKIYSSWPVTGSMQKIGGDAIQSVTMCLEDFGMAAGGFAIEHIHLDDGVAANNGGWEAGKVSENANTAVNDADAMVYMATYNSGAAKIAIPIVNEGGMAMISYANTYPGLTKAVEGATEEGEPDKYYPSGKRNYMRVCPADEIQGGAAATWAYNESGRRKAYVLHDESLYGKGVANVFQLDFAKLGGEVLGFEGYDKLASDYQSLMTSIADMGPDIIYNGATVENNAGKVLQDMRSLMGDEVIFLGPDGLNSQTFVDSSGDAAEGAYITFAGYTADELLRRGGPGADYVTRITERIGTTPDAYAVYGYETMVVVLQAIDRVGEKDRTKIIDAMMATEGFSSLLGTTWSFLDTGDTDSAIIGLSQVQGTVITYQKAISGE